jgi:hypothetical protein
MFGGGMFNGIFFGMRRPAPPSPAQIRNSQALEEMEKSQVEAKEDSCYDAMTEAQRDAYYVNPGVWTRIARWSRGR